MLYTCHSGGTSSCRIGPALMKMRFWIWRRYLRALAALTSCWTHGEASAFLESTRVNHSQLAESALLMTMPGIPCAKFVLVKPSV